MAALQMIPVRPEDLPRFPVLAEDIPHEQLVTGLWLWITEVRYRYPGRDVAQWVIDVLTAEHLRHGQRLIPNPFSTGTATGGSGRFASPSSSSSSQQHRQKQQPLQKSSDLIDSALRQTHPVILQSLAKSLQLSPWWCTATAILPTAIASAMTPESMHQQAKVILDHFIGVDRLAKTDMLPNVYLPIDPFRDTASLPQMRVLV